MKNRTLDMHHEGFFCSETRRASWNGWFPPIAQGDGTNLFNFLSPGCESPWLSMVTSQAND